MNDHPYPVRFVIKSKLAANLVKRTPSFRGHIPVLSLIMKLLPVNREATMHVDESVFKMCLDYSTHLSYLKLSEYEALESSVVARTLLEGDNCLDIGANWGYFTALASHYVGSAGTVYSIEANPTTFTRLNNMLRNSDVSNVRPFNLAVCHLDGQRLDFFKPFLASDAFGHLGKKSFFLDRKERVLSTTLDDFWRKVGKPVFRLVKIDVEGMEPLVLAGGKECLEAGVTDCVLIEINSWTNERSGKPYQICYRLLTDYGFHHVYVPESGKYKKIDLKRDSLPYNKTLLFTRSAFSLESSNMETSS